MTTSPSPYLSSTMRALLTKAHQELIAVLLDPKGRVINVGWVGATVHEFRPLGVRLALKAGHVAVTSEADTPKDLAPWRKLVLTEAGRDALRLAQSRATTKRRGRP